MIAHIQTSTAVTVYLNSNIYTVSKDDPRYVDVISKLAVEDEKGLGLIFNPMTRHEAVISKFCDIAGFEMQGTDIVRVSDGKRIPSGNVIVQKIYALYTEKRPISYLVNMLNRLLNNPSYTAIQELYLFLEKVNIPITPDGYILAYRKVRPDYYSFHQNPDGSHNKNEVGDVVTQDRS